MRFLLLALLLVSAPLLAERSIKQQIDNINTDPKQHLEQLSVLEKKTPFQDFYLAYTYYRLGNVENALSHAEFAIKASEHPELLSRAFLLKALTYGIHKRDTKTALTLLEKAHQALPPLTSKELFSLQVEIFESFAQAYNQLGQPEKALSYAQQSLELALTHESAESELDARIILGRLELQNNHLAQALMHLQRAAMLAVELKNDPSLASIYTRLGMFYQKINQFEAASEQFQQAAELYEKLNLPSNQSLALVKLGDSSLSAKRPEAAEQYYKQALALASKQKNSTDIANVYVSQSELAIERGDLDQAKALLEKAHQLFSQTGSQASLREVNLFLASLYLKQNNLLFAEQILEELSPIIPKSPKFMKVRFYHLKSTLAHKKNEWKIAYEYQQLANEQQEEDNALQKQFQADSLEQSLYLQKALAQSETLYSQQKLFAWLMSGFSAVLLVGMLLMVTLKKNNANKRKPKSEFSNWRQFIELVLQASPHQPAACAIVITPADLDAQLLKNGPVYYEELPSKLASISQHAIFHCWHQNELWLYCHTPEIAARLTQQISQLGADYHSAILQLQQFNGPAQPLPPPEDIRQLVWECWALASKQGLQGPYHAKLMCPQPINLSWHRDSLQQDLFNAISLGQIELLVNQHSLGEQLQKQLRQF